MATSLYDAMTGDSDSTKHYWQQVLKRAQQNVDMHAGNSDLAQQNEDDARVGKQQNSAEGRLPVIRLPNNWKPRPYQRKVWKYWEDGGKDANLIWHRRSGKDEIALHRTAVAAFERPATYWHLLPEAAHARKAIWTAVNPHSGKRRIDEAFPIEIRKTTREQEMFIEFVDGSTWQVGGSDRYNALAGSSEYSLASSSKERPSNNSLLISLIKTSASLGVLISEGAINMCLTLV